jgi:hypothetical protein
MKNCKIQDIRFWIKKLYCAASGRISASENCDKDMSLFDNPIEEMKKYE